MEKAEKEATLRYLYYESPKTKYRSPEHLYQLAKEENPEISKNFVKDWLLGQSSYTRFKKWNHPKHFRHTFVKDFDQLQMDLVILGKYRDENNGYENMLVAIEILSRYCFVEPLKSKRGEEIKKAIENVIEKFEKRFGNGKLKYIQFDEGSEFLNKDVKSYLESLGIEYFYTYSPRKASVVERVNKTIKMKMDRMFEKEENHQWEEKIQELVYSYNDSIHSSIGMRPNEVNEENKYVVWGRLYGNVMEIKKPRYKVGDEVRVLNLNIKHRVAQLESKYNRGRSDKGKVEEEKLFGDYFKEKYKDNDPERVEKEQHAVATKRPPFSREILKIDAVKLGDPVVYKLWSEEFGREIKGIFYEEELSLIKRE